MFVVPAPIPKFVSSLPSIVNKVNTPAVPDVSVSRPGVGLGASENVMSLLTAEPPEMPGRPGPKNRLMPCVVNAVQGGVPTV